MQNNLDSKNLEIQQIKKKYSALEISVKEIKKENIEIEERVADITQHNETFLNESIAVLENSVRVPDNPIFKCSNCKFTTESERGLKVHIKRKHEHLEEEGFPKVCEFCDYKCFNKQSMVDHLTEHSFRNLKLKCEDCDFLSEDKLSLEVHAGKKHSGNFECALCGFSGSDLEHLETHLHTCERFTCTYCHKNTTFSNIPDLKSHLSSQHPKHLKHTEILHIKMDRKDSEKVSTRTVYASYFF